QPDVRRVSPAVGRRRAGVRLFRHGRRGSGSRRRARHHPGRLPAQAVGQSAEHEPAQGLMTGTAVDLIWLAPALALLGFVLNGTLALTRPNAKTLVSVIGAGVLLAAFAVSIAIFSAFAGLHAAEPFVFRDWSWIPGGTLQIDFAFQVDQLSLVMLLV